MSVLKVTTPDCGKCGHPHGHHSRLRADQSTWEAGSACSVKGCECEYWTRPAGVPVFSEETTRVMAQDTTRHLRDLAARFIEALRSKEGRCPWCLHPEVCPPDCPAEVFVSACKAL